MSLEDLASETNEFFFLREFTFSRVTFRPNAGQELELADGIIWIDDLAIIFQMKERATSASNSPSARNRWFESKVIGRATRQIRDTLRYLDLYDPIIAKNSQGQEVLLSQGHLRTMHKIVLFQEDNTESFISRPKFHLSQSAGLIHLMPIEDYEGVVRITITPPELSEYLTWREALYAKWQERINKLPEQSLVGHYLYGYSDPEPSLSDASYLKTLQADVEKWDLTGILGKFLDRTTDGITGIDYHLIIQEVAKLDRAELQVFKERFAACMNRAKAEEFRLPYRFSTPRTGCGFVFIPLQNEFRENRRTALVNMTALHKYDQRLEKCIGISFVADEDGWFTVDWCIQKSPWEFNEEIQTALESANPFRPVSERLVERYTFRT
jgi:hypothetical protein